MTSVLEGVVQEDSEEIFLRTAKGQLSGRLLRTTIYGASEIWLDGDPFPIWVNTVDTRKRTESMARKKAPEVEEEVDEVEVELYTKAELNKMDAKALGEVADALEIEDHAALRKPAVVKAILARQEELQAESEEDEDEDEIDFNEEDEDDDDEDSDEDDSDEDEDEEDEDEEDEDEDEEDLEEDEDEDDEDEDDEDEDEEPAPKRGRKAAAKAAPAKKAAPARRSSKSKVTPGKNPFVASTQKGAIVEVLLRNHAGKKAWVRSDLLDALEKAGVETKSKKRAGVASRLNRALKDLGDNYDWEIFLDGPNSSENQVISVWHEGAGQTRPKAPKFKESTEDRDKREARKTNLAKAQAARGQNKATKTTKTTKAVKETPAKTTTKTKATATTAKKGRKARA